MKALFVVPNYEPAWSFGGVMRCISTLCRGLVEKGVSVTVYTTNVDGRGGQLSVSTEKKVNVGGVSVVYFPSSINTSSDCFSIKLSQHLKETVLDFDIVYIAANWQWIGISACHIARKSGVPYILGTHGSFGAHKLKKGTVKKGLFWHLFLKRCFKYASAIHLTSEQERREARLIDSQKSFIVPNCIPDDAFILPENLREAVRREFHIDKTAYLLLMVGRPDPIKRIDIAMKALKSVFKEHSNVYLMVVGHDDNEYAISMKKLATELNISDHVIWTGFRSGDLLKGSYAAADVFLLPSMDENFGMVVAEAMAAALPVIISNNVGMADDVVKYGAGIVVPVDEHIFAAEIIELQRHRDTSRDLGLHSKEIAKRYYSIESVSNQMIGAFEDVLSRS